MGNNGPVSQGVWMSVGLCILGHATQAHLLILRTMSKAQGVNTYPHAYSL